MNRICTARTQIYVLVTLTKNAYNYSDDLMGVSIDTARPLGDLSIYVKARLKQVHTKLGDLHAGIFLRCLSRSPVFVCGLWSALTNIGRFSAIMKAPIS